MLPIYMHRNWHPCVIIVGVHPTNQLNISTHKKEKKEVLGKEKKRKKNVEREHPVPRCEVLLF